MNPQRPPVTPPVLRLVRHAPIDGADGVCYGASDWPANAAATVAFADTLAEQVPHGLRVSVSPLQRCRQLAEALQVRRRDLVFAFDPRLREFNFGAWEGRRWAEIDQQAFDHWLAGFWRQAPAAGAETMAAFMSRVASAWDECRARSADAVWITHAGVIRAAMLLERDVCFPVDASHWPREAIRSDVIYALKLAPVGGSEEIR